MTLDMLNIMMKACDTDANAGESWFNTANYNKHAFPVERQELNNLIHAGISRKQQHVLWGLWSGCQKFLLSHNEIAVLDTFEKYMLFVHIHSLEVWYG